MPLFSWVNAWLVDSRATQPTGAQGDGGRGSTEGVGGGGDGGREGRKQRRTPESSYAVPQNVLRLCLQNTTDTLLPPSTPAATTLVRVIIRT